MTSLLEVLSFCANTTPELAAWLVVAALAGTTNIALAAVAAPAARASFKTGFMTLLLRPHGSWTILLRPPAQGSYVREAATGTLSLFCKNSTTGNHFG